MKRAALLLALLGLAGCPKGRTYVIRAYDGAGGKSVGTAIALGAPIAGVTASWSCPGEALPPDVAKNRAWKPQRDGSLVASFYEDVAAACSIVLAIPGAAEQHIPVGEVCAERHGEWCAGLDASVLVATTRSPGAGLAVVASAIPLDAPRPARGGDIETVLSVVLQADGETRVDGKKVDDAGLLAAATKAKSANPELRAVIKADRAVQHGSVIHVLDLLKQAGVGRIAFGVAPVAP